MTPPVVIREASAADVGAIVAVVNRAFVIEEFFVEGTRTSDPDVAERMTRGSYLVVEGDAGIVGAVFVEAHDEVGHFGMLAVDPDAQGTGLGRLLVHAAEEWCRACGCAVVEIQVVDVRTELPPFYERLGYAYTGGAQPFPDPDRAKLACCCRVMRKRLDS